MANYNNSGIVIYSEDKVVLHIPHKAIIWMIPNGLTRQKKEKMSKAAIDEAVEKLKEIVDSVYTLTGRKPSIIASKEILEEISKKSGVNII